MIQDNRLEYGWLRGGNKGVTGQLYQYGWPAGGTSQPNVVAQWIFDEASGNIVDEVSSITLVPAGTPTYGQTTVGSYRLLSPGIALEAGDTFTLDPYGTWNFANTDFVIEAVVAIQPTTTLVKIISMGAHGISFQMDSATTTTLGVADDLTSRSCPMTLTKNFRDGLPHKFRLKGNGWGTIFVYIDGFLQGGNTFSSLNGKAFTSEKIVFGDTTTAGATWYEVRVTIGNQTNNSGGINGG